MEVYLEDLDLANYNCIGSQHAGPFIERFDEYWIENCKSTSRIILVPVTFKYLRSTLPASSPSLRVEVDKEFFNFKTFSTEPSFQMREDEVVARCKVWTVWWTVTKLLTKILNFSFCFVCSKDARSVRFTCYLTFHEIDFCGLDAGQSLMNNISTEDDPFAHEYILTATA